MSTPRRVVAVINIVVLIVAISCSVQRANMPDGAGPVSC